jgi:hypothetical protein
MSRLCFPSGHPTKLIWPERHILLETRDQKRICHGQQREMATKRDLLRMQETDETVCQRRKHRIDARHRVRDTADESVGLGRLQRDLERMTYGAQTHEKRSR